MDAVNGGVNGLAEVVRGDIGRHTDRNTHRAVYQEVGEAGGEHAGLAQTVIVVGYHDHHVLVQILEHFVRDLVKARLGITVCCRRVTVHATEVTATLYQGIAQRKGLCHTYKRAVDRGVTVWVITTQHVTDRFCRFLRGSVVRGVILVHSVQHTALTGLQTVAHVGQRTGDDNRHGVFNKGFFNLLIHTHVNYLLLVEKNILVFLISFVFSDHVSTFLRKFVYILMLDFSDGKRQQQRRGVNGEQSDHRTQKEGNAHVLYDIGQRNGSLR